MKLKSFSGIAAVLLLFVFHSGAYANPSSTFEFDSEGWQIAELPGPPYSSFADSPFEPFYSSTIGNSGGAIHTTDRNANLFTFSAPSLFLGNKESYFGGQLKFDLLFFADSLPPGFAHPDVVLWGNGQTLVIDSFQDPLTQANLWLSHSVSLTAAAGWRNDGLSGTFANESQIRGVLANLTGLFIRGDYFSGIEHVALDNVSITPVPEPETYAMMLAGLGLLGVVARRRKQKSAT